MVYLLFTNISEYFPPSVFRHGIFGLSHYLYLLLSYARGEKKVRFPLQNNAHTGIYFHMSVLFMKIFLVAAKQDGRIRRACRVRVAAKRRNI